MATKIISYQTDDGCIFDTAAKAVFHEAQGVLVADLADVFSEYAGEDQLEGWNFDGMVYNLPADDYVIKVDLQLANFLALNLVKINDWFGHKPVNKGQAKVNANGISPLTSPPGLGASYYVVDLSHYDYCVRKIWNSSPSHLVSTELARGLCHKTKKAAVAHAKVLLGCVVGGEE